MGCLFGMFSDVGRLFGKFSELGCLFGMFSDVGLFVNRTFSAVEPLVSGTFRDGTFCMCTYPIKPYLFVNNTGAVVAHQREGDLLPLPHTFSLLFLYSSYCPAK